mgnify:CR=1 FL=1
MKFMRVRQSLTVLCLISVCVLAACSSKPRAPVPVEDRVAGSSGSQTRKSNAPQQTSAPVAVSTPVSMGASLPGSENAGKPGYYSVRAGDTLTKIALDHGQAWRDIAKWNGLDNPNVIEVDQVLRVAPDAKISTAPRPVAQQANVPAPAGQPAPAAQPSPAMPPAAQTTAEDGLAFSWPHGGQVISGFDETKNKGLDFAGKAGDPVLAAADGKVVYAGSGLRGYGNLVILKHNNTYLTAYAHNQTLLVKEEQAVVKGQRIAEMGNSDADRVKLHFEIRKQGKPVDPSKYLPSRP